MSRTGKAPVPIPSGTTVRLDGQKLTAKGKLGERELTIAEAVEAIVEGDVLTLRPRDDSAEARVLWGTSRSLAAGAVRGVSEGFTRQLEINGVGYRAAVEGKTLRLQLGYSHDVEFPIPDDVKIACERPTLIAVSGIDKQRVGQVAAEIREYRKPEPYKGKGIKYSDETIFRKEGKKK